jgi:hypothetical protein
MPRVLLKVLNLRDPTLYQGAAAVEAGALGLYVIHSDVFRLGMTPMTRAAIGSAGYFAYSLAVDSMPYSGSGSGGSSSPSAVFQTANGSPTRAVAKAGAAAAATAAYASFVMRRQVTNPIVLQFCAVVFGASLASGYVADMVDSGLEKPDLGPTGLTPESFVQAAGTAAISSVLYRSTFAAAPNMRNMAFVFGADIIGQVAGTFIDKGIRAL